MLLIEPTRSVYQQLVVIFIRNEQWKVESEHPFFISRPIDDAKLKIGGCLRSISHLSSSMKTDNGL